MKKNYPNFTLKLLATVLLIGINTLTHGQIVLQDSTYTDNSFGTSASSKIIHQYNEHSESIGYESYRFETSSRKWIGTSKHTSTYTDGATEYAYTYYQWNSVSNSWGEHYQKIEYEVENGVTTGTQYNWEATGWVIDSDFRYKSYYETNSDNKATLSQTFEWNEKLKDWINSWKIEYDYFENGNQKNLTWFQWDKVTNTWQNWNKQEYTYDAQNNKLTEDHYLADEKHQLYKYSEKIYKNEYDANNNLTEVITTLNYLTHDIPPSLTKEVHLYDKNNFKTETITYFWNNNDWVISNRQTFFTKNTDQVFNAISPSNFGINIGTLFEIPVLEKPIATSREWKYKKGGESTYSSFSPKQTNSTLSKIFTEAGDYEIICESNINGQIYTSNNANLKVIGISIAPTATQNINVDELGKTLTVSESPEADSRYWYYSKTSGGPYERISYNARDENYNPEFSEPGTYYVICQSKWGNTTVNSNEVIVNVSGTKLSSTETQLLRVGETGEDISVIEYPTSDSREWKYKTSETGIWKSFTPAITTSNYTPSFSTIGEYYIACFSEYGNDVQMSDMAKVWVVEQNKIDPVTEQTIDVLQDGSELTVTEFPTADSRSWYYSSATDDFTNNTNTGTLNYTPNFDESGIFYVVCKSKYDGVELTSNPVKVNVIGNDISPYENQCYVTGNIGNTLKVNENIIASSREWKYKTSEAGSWQSFSPIEDSTFLNPSFTTIGTYYIACFSTIEGKDYTSNEVRVRVVEATTIAPSGTQTININTDGDLLTVSENTAADSRYWHVSKVSGQYNYTTNTYKSAETYQPKFSESGTYYVVCQSKWDNTTVTSNEVVITVNGYGSATFENSIAPTAEQIIDINTNGTDLTVTESPVADSRYWYYSKNEPSNFTSNTYRTTETYTPRFNSLGVHYVICKSKLDTLYKESNYVKISVHGNKISSTSSQSLVVGYNGKGLSVEEYPAATSREWKYKLTSGGTWQSFSTPETTPIYTPNFAKSGEYYIACFSTIEGKVYETNDVIIRVSGNNITPTTTQNVNPNVDGNTLTVNEDYTSSDREWFASTVSGKEYFNYLGDGTTYTPNISEAGVYYIVCKSTWSNGFMYSNEVQVNVSGNNVSPINDQTITPSTNGSTLNVNEYPSATSREWKYKTSPGGSWNSFSTAQTSANYTPNFASTGTYYIACFSVIGGSSYTSNEVMVTVADNSISPANQQTIPVNTDGTQLSVSATIPSDSRGWYYSITSGKDYDSYLGNDATYTPNFTEVGEYFIVCKSNWGDASKLSNEVKVAVAGNNIAPTTEQTIAVNSEGSTITVTEYPTASSREWKYKTSPSGSWTSFSTLETAEIYTPNFAISGNYYVACFSEIEGSTFASNEVIINVASNSIAPIDEQILSADTDGSQLTVSESIAADSRGWYYSTTSGSGYDNYLEDGLTYTPNFSGFGEYFIVCKSTWGTTVATSNEVHIVIAGNGIEPENEQSIAINKDGLTLTVTEFPTQTSREWKYKTSEGGPWTSFSVAETSESYTPNFSSAGTYYIACFSKIGGNTYESNTVSITVNVSSSINSLEHYGIKMFPNPSNGYFTVQQDDILESISVYTIEGKLIYLNANVSTESTFITVPTKGIHTIILKTKDGRKLFDKIIIH
ncbi:T9SS type A sorting domain-containing protein [Marinilabilia rubra]|nr:T9SS type A sorting domain-containing protein [Marinilabilia rubra]